MNNEIGTLLTLAGYFALLSLFAIGGANAALLKCIASPSRSCIG